MKLYIPTCTLNFNNIFSTESISPALFYRNRGFGNKRYYKVEANNKDDVILLYSKYPEFSVDNEDLENAPMVIEIETETAPLLSIEKIYERDNVQVFATSESIYFTPFNTVIYFKSYQDLQSVLTKAEQSLENKYSKLYSTNFKIRKYESWSISNLFTEKDYFQWNDSFVRNTDNVTIGNPKRDLFIDRLKGCLVCYLIGVNTSVSPEVGRLKQIARKIRNVLSAIVNSPEHKPTEFQDATLLKSIEEFNSIYAGLDENSKYNSELIDKRLISPSTGLNKDVIKKVLSDLGLIDVFFNRLNLRPVYNAYDVYNCLNSSSLFDSYQAETARMNEAIKRLEILQRKSFVKRQLSDLISYEDKRIVIKDSVGQGAFLPALLESQMNGDYKVFMNENGIDERLAVAFVGGAKLKSFIKEKWEGSEFQNYVNGLLANLQKGDAFDVFSINNSIMQSFAVYCQKGEDIDRLKDYMLQLGFGNYQFALAIYGASKGFASLPKTFTNSLIYPCDFYIDFYKDLCRNLFNVELKESEFINLGTVKEIREKCTSNIIELKLDTDVVEKEQTSFSERLHCDTRPLNVNHVTMHSPRFFMSISDIVFNTRTNVYKALKKSDFTDDICSYTEKQFRDRILTIIESSLPVTKSSRNDILMKVNKIIELEGMKDDYDGFMIVLNSFVSPKDASFNKILNFVFPKTASVVRNSEIKISEISNLEVSLPKLPNIKSFSSLPDKALRRLEQNWKFTESKYPSDRVEHIKFFINLCKKEGRGETYKPTSLRGVFSERIALEAEKELYDYYHVR